MIKVLFIGDICGKAGRRVLAQHLPVLRSQVDFVIANGENAAGGFGLHLESAKHVFAAGVDCVTLGNHTWDQKDIYRLLDDSRLVRPLNYPLGTPGRGWQSFQVGGQTLTVINLLGRTFMDPLDCPFQGIHTLLQEGVFDGHQVFVDFHAEATSEKTSMAHFLDGRVAAVVGTHTHIPTADTRVLPKGTGYQTDAGMTGALESVIGFVPDEPIARYVDRLPARWKVAEGRAQFNAVVVHLENNACTYIERYQYTEPLS